MLGMQQPNEKRPESVDRKDLLEFVRQHDPQLEKLLGTLEKSRPQQFKNAMQNLAKETERLKSMETRDPERFELELRAWKNNKKIQIESAKIALKGESKESRDALRVLCEEKNSIRARQLELELARNLQRTEKLTSQLAKLKSVSEIDLDWNLDQVIASARRSHERGRKAATKVKSDNAEINKDQER
jgi:hypothetical protein